MNLRRSLHNGVDHLYLRVEYSQLWLCANCFGIRGDEPLCRTCGAVTPPEVFIIQNKPEFPGTAVKALRAEAAEYVRKVRTFHKEEFGRSSLGVITRNKLFARLAPEHAHVDHPDVVWVTQVFHGGHRYVGVTAEDYCGYKEWPEVKMRLAKLQQLLSE